MSSEVWTYLQGQDLGELGRDVLDVVITYYVFYRVALVLKGTRAMQVGVGLASVFLVYIVAQLLHLQTVLTLLQAVLSSAILIGVVVFQNDIRRGLMRMGSRAKFGTSQTLEGQVIDDVVEAATILARHRIGAIITFEQEANLDEFVGSHTGHVIDAAVSAELLVSMFIPEGMNKLHDGALIIRDLRIAKAGVFFPMPEDKVMDESFGSRHRAAMGITEETDAVVVIVSEERGSISFCFNGNIVSNLDGERLRAALEGVFAPKKTTKKRGMRSLFSLRPSASSRNAAVAEAVRKSALPAEVPAPAPITPEKADTEPEQPPVDSLAQEEPQSTSGGATESVEGSAPESATATPKEGAATKGGLPAEEPKTSGRTTPTPPAEATPGTDPVPKPLRKLVSGEGSAEPARKPVAEGELVAPTKKQVEALKTPLRHLAARPKDADSPKSEHPPRAMPVSPKRESAPPPDDAPPGSRRLVQRTEAEPDKSGSDAP